MPRRRGSPFTPILAPVSTSTLNSTLDTYHGRLLARNGVLNLLGQLAPLLAAVVAIPLLLAGLGTDRFGLLAIVWMAIGYFGLFDLGLGRALTQVVATRMGAGREDEVPALVWTAEVAMVLMGAVGGVLIAALAPTIVRDWLNVPLALQREALLAFRVLAVSLPWVIGAAGLRGLLEARQEFGRLNAVRIPAGVLSFLGPVLVLPFSSSLVPVVAVLAAGRIVAWAAYLWLCLRSLPGLRGRPAVSGALLRPLLRFGGWMTVTNIVSPIMVYFDRFLIGAVISVGAVAYYATPYEVVTKLWLIPGALLGVLFPAFAAAHRPDPRRLLSLFDSAVRILALLVFPVAVLLVTLAEEGLTLWLGGEFARVSAPVLQWLTVGVFINCIAQVPFTLVQAVGRPDLTARFHLLELPVYLVAIWFFTLRMGIEGAAIAWAGRAALDGIVLFAMAVRLAPGSALVVRRTAALMIPGVVLLGVGAAISGPLPKAAFLLATAIAFATIGWTRVLNPGEQTALVGALRTLPVRFRPPRWIRTGRT